MSENRQKPGTSKDSTDKLVKGIKHKAQKQYSAEGKTWEHLIKGFGCADLAA